MISSGQACSNNKAASAATRLALWDGSPAGRRRVAAPCPCTAARPVTRWRVTGNAKLDYPTKGESLFCREIRLQSCNNNHVPPILMPPPTPEAKRTQIIAALKTNLNASAVARQIGGVSIETVTHIAPSKDRPAARRKVEASGRGASAHHRVSQGDPERPRGFQATWRQLRQGLPIGKEGKHSASWSNPSKGRRRAADTAMVINNNVNAVRMAKAPLCCAVFRRHGALKRCPAATSCATPTIRRLLHLQPGERSRRDTGQSPDR